MRPIGILYPPPIGEFDENETSLDPVEPQIILFLVVVDPEVKHRARPQLIAEQKAGVNFLVVIVVIRYQTQGQVP